jgi:alginate O-acetyltransferase complex protein AlgI
MTFNSPEYILFLFTVFLCYWNFSQKVKIQNLIVLIANFIFYGWWSFKFLLLIIICSLIDFFLSFKIYNSKKYKLFFLSLSISLNLGVVFYFKYFSFFFKGLTGLFHSLNIQNSFIHMILFYQLGLVFSLFKP